LEHRKFKTIIIAVLIIIIIGCWAQNINK
jgi:hypothetical protein